MTETHKPPSAVRQGIGLLSDCVQFSLYVALAASANHAVVATNCLVAALAFMLHRAVMTSDQKVIGKSALVVAFSAFTLTLIVFAGNLVWLVAGPFPIPMFYAVLLTIWLPISVYVAISPARKDESRAKHHP